VKIVIAIIRKIMIVDITIGCMKTPDHRLHDKHDPQDSVGVRVTSLSQIYSSLVCTLTEAERRRLEGNARNSVDLRRVWHLLFVHRMTRLCVKQSLGEIFVRITSEQHQFNGHSNGLLGSRPFCVNVCKCVRAR